MVWWALYLWFGYELLSLCMYVCVTTHSGGGTVSACQIQWKLYPMQGICRKTIEWKHYLTNQRIALRVWFMTQLKNCLREKWWERRKEAAYCLIIRFLYFNSSTFGSVLCASTHCTGTFFCNRVPNRVMY